MPIDLPGRACVSTAARRAFLSRLLAAGLPMAAGPSWAAPAAAPAAGKVILPFDGMDYLHRWSRDGQHEFTPAGNEDLAAWRDMLTLNVHARVQHGEALADLANGLLTRYREHGKVLVTRSVPRTAARPAEHLVVAVLGQPQFLEAAFARVVLHQGTGLVAVRSRRIYGKGVGPDMSRWLAEQGLRTEQALMAWATLPPLARLNALPQA